MPPQQARIRARAAAVGSGEFGEQISAGGDGREEAGGSDIHKLASFLGREHRKARDSQVELSPRFRSGGGWEN